MFISSKAHGNRSFLGLAFAVSVTLHVFLFLGFANLNMAVPTDREIGKPEVASSVDVVVDEVEELI